VRKRRPLVKKRVGLVVRIQRKVGRKMVRKTKRVKRRPMIKAKKKQKRNSPS